MAPELGEYYHQLDKMQREADWITTYTLGTSKHYALKPLASTAA